MNRGNYLSDLRTHGFVVRGLEMDCEACGRVIVLKVQWVSASKVIECKG